MLKVKTFKEFDYRELENDINNFLDEETRNLIVIENPETIASQVEEIEVIISAGKMERKIMMIIPFLIILYIDLTNKGFFLPLYHNFIGVIIMSICLLVYLAAIKISGKIISIRI